MTARESDGCSGAVEANRAGIALVFTFRTVVLFCMKECKLHSLVCIIVTTDDQLSLLKIENDILVT